MSVKNFDAPFHLYLWQVQRESPWILGPKVKVDWDYSFQQSLRQGSTTHAQNRNVGIDIIQANNCWRKLERSGNRDPSLSMLETYTDAIAS